MKAKGYAPPISGRVGFRCPPALARPLARTMRVQHAHAPRTRPLGAEPGARLPTACRAASRFGAAPASWQPCGEPGAAARPLAREARPVCARHTRARPAGGRSRARRFDRRVRPVGHLLDGGVVRLARVADERADRLGLQPGRHLPTAEEAGRRAEEAAEGAAVRSARGGPRAGGGARGGGARTFAPSVCAKSPMTPTAVRSTASSRSASVAIACRKRRTPSA